MEYTIEELVKHIEHAASRSDIPSVDEVLESLVMTLSLVETRLQQAEYILNFARQVSRLCEEDSDSPGRVPLAKEVMELAKQERGRFLTLRDRVQSLIEKTDFRPSANKTIIEMTNDLVL